MTFYSRCFFRRLWWTSLLALAILGGCGQNFATVCGDGFCSDGESQDSCAKDCKVECADQDGDGICDAVDNCLIIPNVAQFDADGDQLGDACDPCPESIEPDTDRDGICQNIDNCKSVANVTQVDSDADGWGDECDTCPQDPGQDWDSDTLCGETDNCPEDANPEQVDQDGDGIGDVCDPCPTDFVNDSDGDGVCESEDICLGGDDTLDADGNGIADECENCGFVEQKRFVVNYENLYTYNNQGPMTFQVILFQDGRISFQYKQTHQIAEAIIGFEAPGDSFAQQYVFDEINVQDDTTLVFTPNGEDFSVESSRDSGGPPFDWVAAEAGQGEPVVLPLADDSSITVGLPFRFYFQGRSYESVQVASNGYLWFGDSQSSRASAAWENSDLPTNRPWEGFIGALWMDLNPVNENNPGVVRVSQDAIVCSQDCLGSWGGYARLDECGVCWGGTTGVAENSTKDCQGICSGTAFLDDCGTCTGGTTNHIENSDDLGCGCFEPAATSYYPDLDNDGLGNGEPFISCRMEAPLGYVSNNDDDEPDCPTNDTNLCGECGALDCNNECFGGAFIDACSICSGGSTGLTPAAPTDSNGDDIPDACNGPDLMIDADYLKQHVRIENFYVAPGDCYIQEGCVTGSGNRKVLRFATMVANVGNQDLAIGEPGDEGWTYNACHDHYHFDDYAFYELFTQQGQQITTVGYKNGWCVMDLTGYTKPDRQCRRYTCSNQGISAGCADIYASTLDCQWIDITHLPDGIYTVRVTTNPDRDLYELKRSNNAAEMDVEISGFEVSVID